MTLFLIAIGQKHIKNAKPILQKALDNIKRWTQNTGFNITIGKTKTIVFTRSKPGNGRPVGVNKPIQIKIKRTANRRSYGTEKLGLDL
jgi:hypothetical protein